jgi:hypothetical protein
MARALPAVLPSGWLVAALAAMAAGCGGDPAPRRAAPPAPAARAAPPDDFLIRPGLGVGRIDGATTREKLGGLFAADALRDERCAVGEGDEISCTRVAIDGQESALVVYWKETGTADVVDVYSDRFHTGDGLRLGLPLADLVALNGGAEIRFYGFDWDYGGTVSNLGGGPLDQPGLEIRLAYASGTDPSAVAPLQGDGEFKSGDPRAVMVRILVDRIRIRLAGPTE